jgi:tRNA(Arg) A34 adenosine deaminase TadA
MNRDRYFLELALKEAEASLNENTYPVGAIRESKRKSCRHDVL